MEFLSYLITGISLGSIYAIIALGYTMVYGIAKMLNFAHGDVIMVGAYVSFYVTMFAGSNLLGEDPSALTTGAVALVSVLLAMVVCTVLGVVIEGLAYRPLRHAGFMSVGAFSGIIAAMSLQSAVPNDLVRMIVALVVGAFFAAIVGFIVGIPVLRLRGDYLAIVTLAFGEIIKDLINCLLVGWDENGLHIALNVDGTKSMSSLGLSENGIEIIKGAQGATGNARIATFAMGFALVMITLVVVLNLVRSRTGRAIMAIRDNRIAAESVGINVTKYKLIAFVTSASLAGAAGALFGLNYSNVTAVQFDFNTSILVLVYVVLGGLGNIWGSIIAAALLTLLPELLRALNFNDYRMLVYAILLIALMLFNNSGIKEKLLERRALRKAEAAEKKKEAV